MARQLQYRRLVLLALMLGVAFVGLAYRLVDLQVLRYVFTPEAAGKLTDGRRSKEGFARVGLFLDTSQPIDREVLLRYRVKPRK